MPSPEERQVPSPKLQHEHCSPASLSTSHSSAVCLASDSPNADAGTQSQKGLNPISVQPSGHLRRDMTSTGLRQGSGRGALCKSGIICREQRWKIIEEFLWVAERSFRIPCGNLINDTLLD